MSGAETMDSSAPTPRDIKPLVSRPVSRRGIWMFVGAAVFGGSTLFLALESRRTAITAPSIRPASGETGEASGMIPSPPELVIPPDYTLEAMAPWPAGPQITPPSSEPVIMQTVPAPRREPVTSPQPTIGFQPSATTNSETAGGMRTGAPSLAAVSQPALVYDANRSAARSRPPAEAANGDEESRGEERVEASRFTNPSTTVPKGTIIQSVLETALDSTRAGLARAIVSRDVYGFDGKKILIPRGSRLIGEYKADVAAGQKRALIQWQRLMRPDGVVINLDSPSADPLGRAGVKGKVNSHFIERFGGTILQSALNIGQQVAVNEIAKGSVIYAIPMMTPSAPTVQQEKVNRTLTVRQGTSVSVFVARDLDFTLVE